MKNSILEKKQISSVPHKFNEDKYTICTKIIYLFSFLNKVRNLWLNYNFFDFFSEISKEKYGINTIFEKIEEKFKRLDSDNQLKEIIEIGSNKKGKEIMRLDAEETNFNFHSQIISKIDKSILLDEEDEKIKLAKENLTKFIKFNGKKVIGFEEFITDITPPVKGYYFKCKYNLKINVHLSGMVINQDKSLKTNIDFYDGEEYIKNMKKLLNIYNN